MPFNFTQEDSATISTTEYSMPADTTTGVPTTQTDTCQLQGWVSIESMAAGDEFLVQLYEKIIPGGTQRVIQSWRLCHPKRFVLIPALILHNGWDLTIKKIAGTDRTVQWSLRKVT